MESLIIISIALFGGYLLISKHALRLFEKIIIEKIAVTKKNIEEKKEEIKDIDKAIEEKVKLEENKTEAQVIDFWNKYWDMKNKKK